MTKADKEGQRKTPILRFKGFTDDWEQRQLQNQVQFFSGLTYSPSDVKDVGTFVIRSSNIKDNILISADNVYVNPNIANSEPVKKDDVIMVVRNGSKSLIGKHALVTRKIDNTVIGAFMTGIRSSTPYFLDALLDTINFKKEIYKNLGATINQITIGNLRKMTFKVPNESEKFKIGSLFKKLNYLLALYERKLKLLSQVKKYFLDNLFAEKEYPNLRFKGFTDAWEKIKLKDTQTTLTDGNYANLYPKPADMTDADKGIPFLTGGNLKNGILDLENAKYITKEKHSQLKSGHLEEDDIVIAVRGSLGELGYVTKQNIDWNINSQLAIIRTSKNELIGKFLLYFFLSSKGKSKLLSRQTGTALKQLPLQQLKTIVVPKTLLLEQQKISNILKTIDKTISFYKGKQQHFAEIKNTLLNTMFI